MAEKKFTTQQKIGIGVAVVTGLAGLGAIFSSFGEDKEEKAERPRFQGFQGHTRRRLGVKSCKPCDK